MKHRLLLPVFIVAIVTGATVGYQYWLLQRLTAQAEVQTQKIVEGYKNLVSAYVLPLQESNTLTPAQEQFAVRINAIVSVLPKAKTLQETLSGISNVQTEIISFVQASSINHATDPRIISLNEEMGERGKIRALLTDYNTTALRWNTAMQGNVGSVATVIGNVNKEPLPFLTFDGRQEFVTEVSL